MFPEKHAFSRVTLLSFSRVIRYLARICVKQSLGGKERLLRSEEDHMQKPSATH
jgi:hypothetical protein